MAKFVFSPFNKDRTSLILILIALLLYIPGIWWGLPQATRAEFIHGWDVDGVAGILTLSEFHNLFIEPKPDWYVAYPLLHYFINGGVLAPYLIYLILTGGLTNPTGIYPFGFQDPIEALAVMALLGRIVTLLMAIGVFLTVYQIGKTLWDRRTGLIAAFVVGVLGPVVFYSRTGNIDMPVLFWTMLGLLVVTRISVDGYNWRRGILLGFFIALSVATKDQAYGLWIPGLLVLFIYHFHNLRKTGHRFDWNDWKGPAATIITGILVYSLASGLLVNPNRYIAHINFLIDYKHTFFNVVALDLLLPSTPAGYLTLGKNIFLALLEAMGPLLIGLSFVGLVVAWRESVFFMVLLAMLIGQAVLVIAPICHMQYRYILFPVVGLSIFASRAFVLGWRGNGFIKWSCVLAFLLGFGYLALRGADLTYQMLFDTRYSARTWISNHIQAGEKVAYFGEVDQLPVFPSGVILERMPEDTTAGEILTNGDFNYVIVSPDWSSEAGMERSRFMDESVYSQLKQGSLGYGLAMYFKPRTIFSSQFKYLAFVNPPVQIYKGTD